MGLRCARNEQEARAVLRRRLAKPRIRGPAQRLVSVELKADGRQARVGRAQKPQHRILKGRGVGHFFDRAQCVELLVVRDDAKEIPKPGVDGLDGLDGKEGGRAQKGVVRPRARFQNLSAGAETGAVDVVVAPAGSVFVQRARKDRAPALARAGVPAQRLAKHGAVSHPQRIDVGNAVQQKRDLKAGGRKRPVREGKARNVFHRIGADDFPADHDVSQRFDGLEQVRFTRGVGAENGGGFENVRKKRTAGGRGVALQAFAVARVGRQIERLLVLKAQKVLNRKTQEHKENSPFARKICAKHRLREIIGSVRSGFGRQKGPLIA